MRCERNDIYEMNQMLNCGYEIKRSYDPCIYECNYGEDQEFNTVSTRDLAMLVLCFTMATEPIPFR